MMTVVRPGRWGAHLLYRAPFQAGNRLYHRAGAHRRAGNVGISEYRSRLIFLLLEDDIGG